MTSASSEQLPGDLWQALGRGIRCRCPRCGQGRLFRKWLKPRERCGVCMLDLTPQRADDFPAYIAMLVTGHLMAPLIIALSKDYDLGTGAMFAVVVPLALVMMLGMLQPAKGAVIAVQWWNGMHGFVRERHAPADGTMANPAMPDGAPLADSIRDDTAR